MMYLIPLLLALVSPDLSVVVLPFEAEKADREAAAATAGLVREVLAGIRGISCPAGRAHEDAMAGKAGAIYERCGRDRDCQLKIGEALGANAVVVGRVEDLGAGVALEVEVLDVGKRKRIGKVSRTLAGSRVHRAAALEALFVGVFYPDRMTGSLDLFIEPEGAAIFLDGQMKLDRAGPQVHFDKLRAGQHTVRLERKGYTDFYAIVQVPYQGNTKVRVRMRPGDKEEVPHTAYRQEDPDAPEPWYRKWWVWTIVGGVITGGIVAGIVLAD